MKQPNANGEAEMPEMPEKEDLPDALKKAMYYRGVIVKSYVGVVIGSLLVSAAGVFSLIPGGIGLLATGLFVGSILSFLVVSLSGMLSKKITQGVMQQMMKMNEMDDAESEDLFSQGFQ